MQKENYSKISGVYYDEMWESNRSAAAYSEAVCKAQTLGGKLIASSNDDCDYRNRSDYPSLTYLFPNKEEVKITFGGVY